MFSDKAKAELQLVRWPNLVILICIQVLAFFTLVFPKWSGDRSDALLYLILLVLMTMFAAAGGYILNDLMDREADLKNGRNNVLNSGVISSQTARRIYLWALAFGALATINLTTWSIHFLWLYAFVIFLLWAYSKYLKRLPFIGNIVVSGFCAGAVGILWSPVHPVSTIPHELLWLTAFAFLITLIREIVKDLEDILGDKHVGDRTLPVVIGSRWSILVVSILLLALIGGLLHPDIRPVPEEITIFCFWLLTMLFLSITLLYLVLKAREQANFHRISLLLKLTMLLGTLFIVL